MSRVGTGICIAGAHGVRIDGMGFEHCANTAIFLSGAQQVAVNNCYFEGDGFALPQHFDNGPRPHPVFVPFVR